MRAASSIPRAERHVHDPGRALPFQGQTDDDLMLLARDGLESAFEELVRRYQVELLRVAARHLGDSALAADLAQNTFLQVYGALHRYEARGLFRAYLHRVLLNQCRMARRSAQVSLRALEHSEFVQGGDEPQVLEREKRRDLERALNRLSDKLRDVVVLRYCGDLDYEQIAQSLSLPIGTVKRRLFDAMAKLREMVEPR
jgi:RNA polymerase sigma-70 factor, ECF subfamily